MLIPVYNDTVVRMLFTLSTSQSDLHNSWVQMNNNKHFLAINDGNDDKFLVFATKVMTVRMQEDDTLFMDGMFYACASFWDQQYSIHCLSGATMAPVAYALIEQGQHI